MIKKFLSLITTVVMLVSLISFSTVNAAVTDYVNLIPNGNFDGKDVVWKDTYYGAAWMHSIVDGTLKSTRANTNLKDTFYTLDVDYGSTYVFSGKIKTDSTSAVGYSLKAGQFKSDATEYIKASPAWYTEISGDGLFHWGSGAWVNQNIFSITSEDGWTPFLSVFTAYSDNATYLTKAKIGISSNVYGTPDYLDDMSLVKCPEEGKAYDTGTGIVVNRTGTEGTAICALYSNNKLVKLETSEDDIFVVPYDSSVGTVTSAKVFFWDSFDTMKPVGNVINVQMQP